MGGFIDYNDENVSFYNLNYSLLTGEEINEEWKTTKVKDSLNNANTDLEIVAMDLSNYYVLIEMNDENNDSIYSQLTKIK